MNWDQIRGNWRQLAGKMIETWGKLTADDLAIAAGHRERVLGAVQKRCGNAREKAAQELDDFANGCKE